MFVPRTVYSSQVGRSMKLNIRGFATSSMDRAENYKRLAVREADSVKDILNSDDYNAKRNPWQFHLSKVSLPETFVQYSQKILQHERLPPLLEGANDLVAHLRFRKPPIEQDEYRSIASRVEDDISAEDSFLEPFLSTDQSEQLEKSRHNKIKQELKRSIYHWEPIHYDHVKALHYLLGRAPADYAALSRVFHEISKRDPKFAPATMLDFGSGVGSVLWAAQSLWSSTLFETMCVDSSREMNDIAELLIRRGNSSKAPMFPGVHFRQFLSPGTERKYDLTVSSYSLMELPSAQARMETLDNLWRKTRNYLVLIEPGSNAGFELINESRDFILQTYKNDNLDVSTNVKLHIAEGHVFAPCPNDIICPRYATDTTPCNFYVKYRPLVPYEQDLTRGEVFCYLVLRKGPRKGTDEQLPRLVRQPLLRGKHTICRLCTKEGELREAVLTKKKHIRPLYATAKRSECGDLLPVQEAYPEQEANQSSSSSESEDEMGPESERMP